MVRRGRLSQALSALATVEAQGMCECVAFVPFALAALALLIGAVIEHRQRAELGPVAMAPTLQYPAAAALLVAIGLTVLRLAWGRCVPWWLVPLGLAATLVFGIWLIAAVGRRADQKAQR